MIILPGCFELFGNNITQIREVIQPLFQDVLNIRFA